MSEIQSNTSELKFPDDFKFGVSTSAYQTEGAWNESGKGENIWDKLTHEHPEMIADKSNGDIACDSYHKYKEDVQLIKHLGINFYRFSLSWSRLLPSSYINKINPDGVRYYNSLIDSLLAANITPMVTLYHSDLPQALQELGGWPNPSLIDYFVDYARFAFQTFGDRVNMWLTFNEPGYFCQFGYGEGINAPGVAQSGIGEYLCGKTVLMAHARTYRMYNDEFKPQQKGKIGMAIHADWYEPKTNSAEDIEAANIAMQLRIGWWAHPVYSKTGDYPEIMKKQIAENSKQENFTRSRLPSFTPEEVKYIQGTYDFFGLNHYTTYLVTNEKKKFKIPSFNNDVGVNIYQDPSWLKSAAFWLKDVPWGFRKTLNWLKEEYDNPEVYITENGFADKGELNDTGRIYYLKGYLDSLLEAIHHDSCNVKGYSFWSLLDNFEWTEGYTQSFGLYKVDFSSPNRSRTAKDSVDYYKNIIQNRHTSFYPDSKI